MRGGRRHARSGRRVPLRCQSEVRKPVRCWERPMSTTGLVQDAETLAVNTLEFLASQVGIATLSEVVDVLTGESDRELVEAVSELVGQLAQTVLTVIGPEKTRAALKTLFDAADKRVDALEDAKFPKP